MFRISASDRRQNLGACRTYDIRYHQPVIGRDPLLVAGGRRGAPVDTAAKTARSPVPLVTWGRPATRLVRQLERNFTGC